jgi:DNA-binding PadR family transcriptional regulator
MPEAIQHYLPLTEATFYILLSMAVERKHGYAMLKDVQALSQGRVSLSTGTLYGALSRLLDQGLIERVEEEDPTETGRLRKFYVLTPRGRRVLEAEIERLRVLVAAAQRRLALGAD